MSDPSLLSPEYNGTKLLVFTAVFIPTQIIAVGLRYLARYLVQGPWGLDDILVFTSLSLQICLAGFSIGRLLASLHKRSTERKVNLPKDLYTTPELATTCLTWKRRTLHWSLCGANTSLPFLSFTLPASTFLRWPFWRYTITSSLTKTFASWSAYFLEFSSV